MNTSTLTIIAIVISISLVAWLVSIWQYDAMMVSMMTFYQNPAALSLFVVIWTVGMTAMMLPAIVPMILVFNRLNNTNNVTSNTPGNGAANIQVAYHRNSNNGNGIGSPTKEGGVKRNTIHRERSTLQSKPPDIILFVSGYLAIWALAGLVLLVGWSLLFDTLLSQLGRIDSQEQEVVSANIIYRIVLIVAGIYQFTSLKSKCLGCCGSPLSFLGRRWEKDKAGALKMGMHHGLYCFGCCWPYFLLMVALGWMNIFWMGLFAAIIFAEKVWTKGGLWIARMIGIGFIIIGILSSTMTISFPTDSMSGSSVRDSDMMISMDMSRQH